MAETLRCYRHPDRETGVSCSECGRGICPDCMTFGPVGIRCPDHAGVARGPAQKVVKNLQRSSAGRQGTVTLTLIAINVGIYFLQLAGGASISANSGWIYQHGALYGPLVAAGDWHRLITAAARTVPWASPSTTVSGDAARQTNGTSLIDTSANPAPPSRSRAQLGAP